MEESRERIAVLMERLENIKDQLNRFVAHLESEQRVTANISKRVDQVDLNIRQHWEMISKHERILFNDGKGLIFRVDRLERIHDNKNWTMGAILSVISILISLLTVIVMMVK